MKWEDYKPQPKKDIYEKQINVECPKCGSKIYRRLDIILTSYPPQYQYDCHNCGWVGYIYYGNGEYGVAENTVVMALKRSAPTACLD